MINQLSGSFVEFFMQSMLIHPLLHKSQTHIRHYVCTCVHVCMYVWMS